MAGQVSSPQAISFRPNHDLLYVELAEIFNPWPATYKWAQELADLNPGCFNGVKALKIHNWDIDDDVVARFEDLTRPIQGLDVFRSLKELRVMRCPDSWHLNDTGHNWSKGDTDRSLAVLNYYLDSVHKQTPSWQVPKITLLPWERKCLPR